MTFDGRQYGKRVLGDARVDGLHDIWTGTTATSLRAELNGGGSTFCGDCPLKLPLKKEQAPVVRPLDAGPRPHRMYIECTAACNISCAQACCAPETGITRTRQAGMLDFELFKNALFAVASVGCNRVRVERYVQRCERAPGKEPGTGVSQRNHEENERDGCERLGEEGWHQAGSVGSSWLTSAAAASGSGRPASFARCKTVQ